MKAKDAYMFPFIAGGFLVGLYLLFKFINKDYVNLLLNIYLLAFGFFALVATLHVLIEEVYSIFASPENLTRFKFTIPLAKSTHMVYPIAVKYLSSLSNYAQLRLMQQYWMPWEHLLAHCL